jgi:hypothetical protein
VGPYSMTGLKGDDAAPEGQSYGRAGQVLHLGYRALLLSYATC